MDELINSIGVITEMTKLIFDNFIRVGFNDYQAMELTKTALRATMQNGKGE